MSTQSAVGKTISGTLGTPYEVRTITKGRTADNKAYVSSLTDGKTHREKGNIDRTWSISVYAQSGQTEIPDELLPGEEITLQVTGDAASKAMIIDSADLEIDIEGGELLGFSLSCSAIDADSY